MANLLSQRDLPPRHAAGPAARVRAPRDPSRPPLGERLPAPGTAAPDEVLGRFLDWVADTGLEPYPAQEEALLELFAGRHVILNTPTGSGKSLVALALHFKALAEGRRSVYTSPIKALASEKFFALCDELGPDRVGMLTGDAAINPGAPVVCCTAEVLANMALREGEGLDVPYAVLDEFHYYADPERGVAWQVPLLALPRTRFLLMSATLGDVGSIAERARGAQRRGGGGGALGGAPGAARLRVPGDAAPRDRRVAGGERPRPDLRGQLHPARVRRAGAGVDQRCSSPTATTSRRSPRRWAASASTPPTARSSGAS